MTPERGPLPPKPESYRTKWYSAEDMDAYAIQYAAAEVLRIKSQLQFDSVEHVARLAVDAEGSASSGRDRTGQAVWRCFHCDETFIDEASAREHFGPSLGSEPACAIDIAKYREMETTLMRWQHQGGNDEEHAREIAWLAREGDHRTALVREEEKGYAKGLADGQALGVIATPLDEVSGGACRPSWGAIEPDQP